MPTTTIVLGAGASVPLGYPSGAALRSQILDNDFPRNLIHHIARTSHWSSLEEITERIAAFRRVFLESGRTSIDRFLQLRRTYAQTGKIAITRHIMEAEHKAFVAGTLFGDWLLWLVDQLVARSRNPSDWPVRFVTFNYDNSVELAISSAIAVAQGNRISDLERRELALPQIVHVHGRVPWPRVARNTVQDLRSVGVAYEHVANGYDSIRVLGEERDIEDAEEDHAGSIATARDWLTSSDNVLILGFAFDPENCKAIGLDAVQDSKAMWSATRIGMTTEEVAIAKSCIGRPVHFYADDTDCLAVMRTHVTKLIGQGLL